MVELAYYIIKDCITFVYKRGNLKEIIDTFYGEGNRILIEATNALLVGVSHSTEKGMRLKKLGFINTKCVKEAEVEMTKLTQAEDLVSAINHFGVKYPNYKFITEKSVENICSKYGLVLLEINRLISDVPDKNLKEIEDFKIDEDDECFMYRDERTPYINYMTNAEYKKLSEKFAIIKCPLEIVLPEYGMENGSPFIVLKPVIFNKRKHYLIVTAWGINHKMN